MAETTSVYLGEQRCESTFGPSGEQIQTDAPAEFQGKGIKFSPTDLFSAALGTCILSILGIVGKPHGLNVAGSRVTVEKELTSSGTIRIGRLPATVRIPDTPSAEVRAEVEAALRACPVHESLNPAIDSPITILWGE